MCRAGWSLLIQRNDVRLKMCCAGRGGTQNPPHTGSRTTHTANCGTSTLAVVLRKRTCSPLAEPQNAAQAPAGLHWLEDWIKLLGFNGHGASICTCALEKHQQQQSNCSNHNEIFIIPCIYIYIYIYSVLERATVMDASVGRRGSGGCVRRLGIVVDKLRVLFFAMFRCLCGGPKWLS
jgi:hypothetical protein